jgi:hypothetical protein
MCEWMTVVTAEDNFDGTEGVAGPWWSTVCLLLSKSTFLGKASNKLVETVSRPVFHADSIPHDVSV